MSIKEDIKKQSYKSVYLLYGEENFLKDYYKKALVGKVLDSTFADFNYKEIISKKPEPEEIDDFLSSYPCMSEKKILFIKNSDLMKKASDADKKYWQKTLSEVPDFVIIIFSEISVDKRNAIYKQIAKDFGVDEFPFQKEADLTDWVRRYAASCGKEILPDTARHLIDCCSPSMYILKNEIEKLAAYRADEKEITKEHIDICCCKIAENRVFEMIDDLLGGNAEKACEKYEELKLLREEPIAINAAIFSKYNQLRKEKILSETMGAREIAAKLGQREYFVNMHLKQIAKIPLSELDKITKMCFDADHKIKNGLSDGWAALDIIIANMI
ncbi:MAG: DNA polymerase III subunit delta [Ruminococcaceae bacterium]|nr:DNA polymerase III subunit delta [Oscillospiraceae bacterium]